MLCTNCKMTRAEDEAPCQHCGAPSSLLRISTDGSWGWGNSPDNASTTGAWNNTNTGNGTGSLWNNTNNGNGTGWGNTNNNTGVSWNNGSAASWDNTSGNANGSGTGWNNGSSTGWGNTGAMNNGAGVAWNNENSFTGSWNNGGAATNASNVPQIAFDAAPANAPGSSGMWSLADPTVQAPRRPTGDLQAPSSQSMLPAIYQGGGMPGEMRRNTTTLQLLPDQMAEQLLPALPDQPVEEMTYIPPMYTQPRPLVPKYRAISGLISVIIVALLVCGGAGYYAQATGKIAAVQQFLTGANTLPNRKPTTTTKIPDPQANPDYGPANNIITSATLASQLDPTGKFAVAPANIFKPKQTFYLTFTVQPQDQGGMVTIQWYTNKLPFTPNKKQINKADFQGHPLNGVINMLYDLPASGIVELYWNNQLAIRLYFAVR